MLNFTINFKIISAKFPKDETGLEKLNEKIGRILKISDDDVLTTVSQHHELKEERKPDRLSQKWLIDLRTFYSSLSSLLERLAQVRSFVKPVVNGKIDRVLKISGYVYGNDVVQDRTTSKPQSSEFPLQEKSLLQKTSQSSSSLPEIKIPTIMDRTAENSSSSPIGNAYLTKKSEAYPAATEIINNSPSRFAKKLRLPFVQNIFDIFKTSISEVISNVKQNLVPQGSPAQFEPVKLEDKKYFEKTPDINATVIIEGDTIKFEYADNAETMLGKEEDRKQKTGTTENRDRHYFFK